VPGPKATVKKIDQEIFRDRFLLVYTGRSHHSGINNWHVIKQWLDGDQKTRAALSKLAEISKQMKSALEENRISDLPKIFASEYEARTELSDGFSSPEIRKLNEIAKSEGAIAKICGAGGGGCVLIWCPDRQIEKVKQALSKTDFQVLPTRPWEPGA
jgi:D-glycero-alpha-D-manno-heptose-7-phosphate kinase